MGETPCGGAQSLARVLEHGSVIVLHGEAVMGTRSSHLTQEEIARSANIPDDKSRKSASVWRTFVNARSARKPFREPIYHPCFTAHVLEAHTGIWVLQVSPAGVGILRCNDCIVTTLSCKDGVSILNTEGCPFERAAEFIAALSNNAIPALHSTTRADFEFALARWIPVFFDL